LSQKKKKWGQSVERGILFLSQLQFGGTEVYVNELAVKLFLELHHVIQVRKIGNIRKMLKRASVAAVMDRSPDRNL
jgi:hypothetical protein